MKSHIIYNQMTISKQASLTALNSITLIRLEKIRNFLVLSINQDKLMTLVPSLNKINSDPIPV